MLDELEAQLPGLTVAKVDVDASPDVAHDLRIQSAPTLMLYVDGEIAVITVGLKTKTVLLGLIEPHRR